MSDSLRPHGLHSPWNSPGQNTGVGSLSLLQGIFPTQGSNPGLLYCRQILYKLSHKGSPRILEWVAYPFSSRSSQSRNRTGVSSIAGRSFTNWAMREVLWRNICSHFNYFLRIDFQKWNYRSKAMILYTHRHIYIKSKLLGPPIIMGCNLSGFSVHGILQAKILEWVAMPSFRGSSWPRDQTCIFYVSCISR